MKGCLAIVVFVLLGFALLVGVFVVVEGRGTSRSEPLTGQAAAFELTDYQPKKHGRQDRYQGADIEYRYVADGRSFASSTWLSLIELRDRVVCFDPDDPAVHAIRSNPEATCGETNHGAVRRAKEVVP